MGLRFFISMHIIIKKTHPDNVRHLGSLTLVHLAEFKFNSGIGLISEDEGPPPTGFVSRGRLEPAPQWCLFCWGSWRGGCADFLNGLPCPKQF